MIQVLAVSASVVQEFKMVAREQSAWDRVGQRHLDRSLGRWPPTKRAVCVQGGERRDRLLKTFDGWMNMPFFSGIVLLVSTVMIHALGTTSWVRFLHHHYATHTGEFKAKVALRVVIWTALILLVLHVVEIVLWAFAYLVLLPGREFKTFEEAVYFSIVTFTTAGYGDVSLKVVGWRILSGVEALNGVLLLGWSTALLYAVVHRTWPRYERGSPKD